MSDEPLSIFPDGDGAATTLAALLETLPVGVLIVARSGGLRYVNPAALGLLRAAGVKVAGWAETEIATVIEDLGLPAVAAGDRWVGSVRLAGSDGVRDVELVVLGLDDRQVAVMLTPVSQAVQAEDRARLLAAVIDQSGDLVAWHGPIGAEARINRAGAAMVGGGVRADTPLPHRIRDLFTPESRQRIEQVGVPEMNLGRCWRDRLQLRDRDTGELREIDWAHFLVHDDSGRLLGSAGVGRDVTDRVRAEAASVQRRLLEAQEEERRRIASDIHDDPAQALTAVSLRLDRLRRRLSGKDAELLMEAQEATATALTRLRRLIFDLHPAVLDEEGLVAALRQYVAGFESTLAPTTVAGDEVSLDRSVRAAAYRVAREAVHNAGRHAGANRIDVQLAKADGGLLVRIIDDGLGFDPEAVLIRPGHLGLGSSRALIEAAGGRYRVLSKPGAGTTVEFWLPSVVGT